MNIIVKENTDATSKHYVHHLAQFYIEQEPLSKLNLKTERLNASVGKYTLVLTPR